MRPTIPLQPYIREGEGAGSAFILPKENRTSALDILLNYTQQQAQRKETDRRKLQEQMIELEGVSANALPKHQEQIKNAYNSDFLAYAAENGRKISDSRNPEYFEAQKKINKIKSDAIKAKIIKEEAVRIRGLMEKNPDKYTPESISNALNYLNNVDLNEFDYQKIPSLESPFNPSDYLQNFTQKFKPESKERYEGVSPLKDQQGHVLRGQYSAKKVKEYGIDKTAELIAADDSYEGKKNQDFVLSQYASMEPAKQQELIKRVVMKNASANEPTEAGQKILRRGIITEMMKDPLKSLFGPVTEVTTISEQQVPSSSGAGKTFDDNYSVVPVQSESTAGSTTDYRAFNAKYGTNYTEKEFNAKKVNFGGSGYFAIEKKGKGGPDTESIQLDINGRQVRPIGYKLENGKIYLNASESEWIATGKEDASGRPIMVNKWVVKKDMPIGDDNAAVIAARLGFSSVDEFKGRLQKEADKKGIKTKTGIKPVSGQGGAEGGNKKTYKKEDWAKLSLAERRKLMQQGIKPE